MGWWQMGENGASFALDSDMIWGDGPADIMGDALEGIRELFREEAGREPTNAELRAGLEFSLDPDDDAGFAAASSRASSSSLPPAGLRGWLGLPADASDTEVGQAMTKRAVERYGAALDELRDSDPDDDAVEAAALADPDVIAAVQAARTGTATPYRRRSAGDQT